MKMEFSKMVAQLWPRFVLYVAHNLPTTKAINTILRKAEDTGSGTNVIMPVLFGQSFYVQGPTIFSRVMRRYQNCRILGFVNYQIIEEKRKTHYLVGTLI